MFLPEARQHAGRKLDICAAHGVEAVAPLDDRPAQTWRDIYDRNIAIMQSCDLVIANLTPFRGASADAGTLIEIGWFLGRSRPVYGYSNGPADFERRSHRQRALAPDPFPDLAIEAFGLADNLMIAGACEVLELPSAGEELPFDSLVVFARCVARVSSMAASRP